MNKSHVKKRFTKLMRKREHSSSLSADPYYWLYQVIAEQGPLLPLDYFQSEIQNFLGQDKYAGWRNASFEMQECARWYNRGLLKFRKSSGASECELQTSTQAVKAIEASIPASERH
jgi:hypothetical protein